MNLGLRAKYQQYRDLLYSMEKVLIAFSGGVDSTFLLWTAQDVLGRENVLAATAVSSTYPEKEAKEARDYAEGLGVEYLAIDSEELDIAGFTENPVNRCYYCKSELFGKLTQIAAERKIKYVLDGSNLDDCGDFRPGMKAAEEKGIRSPLKETGLSKEEIRLLSREMGLPTWNKPAMACLSSRFPYGERITRERLEKVEKAESYLQDKGFKELRVRYHGGIARIEVNPQQFDKVLENAGDISDTLRSFGFDYVTLDLEGFRSGSMNEVLPKNGTRG